MSAIAKNLREEVQNSYRNPSPGTQDLATLFPASRDSAIPSQALEERKWENRQQPHQQFALTALTESDKKSLTQLDPRAREVRSDS